MQIVRIGLDLAKYVFEIHGVDAHGKTVVRKTLRRHAVSAFFANLPPCLVGMEASNGAHFWAKALSDLGHDVRLISPQFVTPYVKSNKNDRNDAEAICEAVGRPNMRFVPVKSAEQLAVQAVHRIRSRLVADRVRLVNQVRGLLGEHGIVVAKDIGKPAICLKSSDDGHGSLSLAEPEEAMAVPGGPGHRLGNLGQAAKGLAIPSEALFQDHDPLELALPLAHEPRAGPQTHALARLRPAAVERWADAILFLRPKDPSDRFVEIAERVGLEPVCQHFHQ